MTIAPFGREVLWEINEAGGPGASVGGIDRAEDSRSGNTAGFIHVKITWPV